MRKRKIIFLMLAVCLLLCGCGKGRTTKEIEQTTFGIDVARYQGTIDWEKVAADGVQFAMVRIGYRSMSTGELVMDANGRYNLQEAAKAEIPLGAYFFSTAISEEEAMEEAAYVCDVLSVYPITYPVAYDCEQFNDPQSRQYGMSRKERTDAALAFLKTVEDCGYEGMFYASKNEMTSQWDLERIEEAGYKIWVAQYPEDPDPASDVSDYAGTHHMWQFSCEGSVAGIDQAVDLNVAYFGYDGIEKPKKKDLIPEVTADPEAMMDFESVSETVTAKIETSLRSIPSQDTDSIVLATLKNGETAQRIAVSANGWSKLEYQGSICYAVSSYLTTDLNYAAAGDPDVQTQFTAKNELVTAKDTVNLRKLPSVENEDAVVLAQLKHGDVATCVGVSDNGWSKLLYNGTTCYAVSSYLEPVQEAAPTESGEAYDIQTEFEPVNEQVTAKKEVNLRTLPSTEHPDVKVAARLYNGQVATRTGINRDLGWSRVEYNGMTLYCISSYLTEAE